MTGIVIVTLIYQRHKAIGLITNKFALFVSVNSFYHFEIQEVILGVQNGNKRGIGGVTT
jgi:hypothetical protein